jgi:hypothetical protein
MSCAARSPSSVRCSRAASGGSARPPAHQDEDQQPHRDSRHGVTRRTSENGVATSAGPRIGQQPVGAGVHGFCACCDRHHPYPLKSTAAFDVRRRRCRFSRPQRAAVLQPHDRRPAQHSLHCSPAGRRAQLAIRGGVAMRAMRRRSYRVRSRRRSCLTGCRAVTQYRRAASCHAARCSGVILRSPTINLAS